MRGGRVEMGGFFTGVIVRHRRREAVKESPATTANTGLVVVAQAVPPAMRDFFTASGTD